MATLSPILRLGTPEPAHAGSRLPAPRPSLPPGLLVTRLADLRRGSYILATGAHARLGLDTVLAPLISAGVLGLGGGWLFTHPGPYAMAIAPRC